MEDIDVMRESRDFWDRLLEKDSESLAQAKKWVADYMGSIVALDSGGMVEADLTFGYIEELEKRVRRDRVKVSELKARIEAALS